MDQIVPNNTVTEVVPTWYYDAFAMRLMGFKYAQIAEKVGRHESRVKAIFSKSGPMYKYWRDFVEVRKSEQIEQSMDMMFGKLPDSIRKLILHAQQGKGLVSLEAIRTHLVYTVGKPEDRIKLDATVGIFNFSDWALAQTEKLKQRQNETDSGSIRPTTPISEGT